MAFSFGGTPASAPAFSFGQQPAATPAFGAAPGLAKASSTPLFAPAAPGAATTPGLFGAAPAPSFSFGGAPSAASPFGAAAASAPAAAGASTGFAFGFGAASAPAASPGLFGGGAALAPFGAAPPAQQALAPPGQLALGQPQAPDLSAVRELEAVRESYAPAPGAPRVRFTYLFLNVVDDPAARVKPPGVDELAWREALARAGGPDNARRLWPVPAAGFRDLLARRAAQEAALRENEARLAHLAALAGELRSRQDAVLRGALEAVRRRHGALCQQLLRVLRRVDAAEGRLAAAVGHRAGAPREALAALAARLSALEAELAGGGGGGLAGRAAALAAAARRGGGDAPPGEPSLADAGGALDDAALGRLHAVLAQHAEALARLQDVARRAARDVAVLEAEGGAR